jgi:hypothetical protein
MVNRIHFYDHKPDYGNPVTLTMTPRGSPFIPFLLTVHSVEVDIVGFIICTALMQCYAQNSIL